MILQALNRYYDRLLEDEEREVPVLGFSRQKIYFGLMLSPEGELLQVLDLREQKGKKLQPVSRIVPYEMEERSGSKFAPHFMWDNTAYVLGADNKGNPKRSAKAFSEFKAFQQQLCSGSDDPAVQAVLKFLDQWNPDLAEKLQYWEEMAGMGIVFQLDGDLKFVHERPAVQRIWIDHLNTDKEAVQGMCLVTGEEAALARLHPAIKGVWGAQAKGAAIISFNLEAFISYGKAQSYNAPVGLKSAFAYTTALNDLLGAGSRQRVQIGDASTVFWTERESAVEGFMGMIFNPGEDTSDTKAVRDYLEAVSRGRHPDHIEDDPDMKFFILGLSPNASRLSVRFWLASTVGEIGQRIGQHFRDLAIAKRYDTDPDYPGMWQLLRETAVQRKTENIPPLLSGALMRAMLTGGPYPQSLLSILLSRIRADQEINYLRAALIKACLVRRFRINRTGMEVGMSLDRESTNTPYRLGRLFAALEHAQKKAVSVNTTIKDRYYGSASATPRNVFPQLLRLTQHHIAKIKQSNDRIAGWYDKQIEEILAEIDAFPAHLKIEEQGLFALGYYHQRADFYKKTEKTEEE